MTYKPDVADIRESPALEIIDGLAAAGAGWPSPTRSIESLETPARRAAVSATAPREDAWDLVLIHTRHADMDHDWLTVTPCSTPPTGSR